MTRRRIHALSLPDGRRLELGRRTLVMGILNVTPDSFADGGRYLDPVRARAAARRLEAEGADLIDIGGESTRPGADPVGVDEELRRVLPVLDDVAGHVRVPISVDTYKAEVARRAVEHGASIINDISSLRYDPDLAGVVAATGAPVVLMHNRGRAREMYRDAQYERVVDEVVDELTATVERAVAAGVAADQTIIDPGLGFAKRAEQTFAMLASLGTLSRIGRPILVGPSRKSFLTKAIGDRPPADREWGTAAAVVSSVLYGAHIVRVHGVREMLDVVKVADEITSLTPPHDDWQ